MGIDISSFPRHCGSRILSNFHESPRWSFDDPPPKHCKTLFGIFINTERQRQNYEWLKKKYEILYQSPVLRNPSTGNHYFIVIWLNQKPKKVK